MILKRKFFSLFVLFQTLALSLSLVSFNNPNNMVKSACCYFAAKDKDISQPGQKAFISWNPKDKTESFTVQPKFEGNAIDFGMVIPTPGKPKLDEMPRDFFKDLAMYTILMPLPEPIYSPLDPPRPCAMACAGAGGNMLLGALQCKKSSVKILESGVVGSLDYKVIVADDANGLYEWLKSNKYSYAGDESTLKFYIDKKWFFTVMKIDPKQMKRGAGGSYLGEVTPTRFTFASNECIYPLRITKLSVKDKTEALFYVQSPAQMDLQGDFSWMHSYRVMYLTYMLGCSVDLKQQQELQTRNSWVQNKQAKDPEFETTKLEWAKILGPTEMSVLEDPLKNYAQMGTGDLPPGARVISLADFLKSMKAEYLKANKKMEKYQLDELARMEDRFQPSNGLIIKYDPKTVGKGFIYTNYAWYPARKVPQDDVKGLTRLKGHLQEGMWLTKFRKVLRKQEMNNDLVLVQVPKTKEETYLRVMPTSPP